MGEHVELDKFNLFSEISEFFELLTRDYSLKDSIITIDVANNNFFIKISEKKLDRS